MFSEFVNEFMLICFTWYTFKLWNFSIRTLNLIYNITFIIHHNEASVQIKFSITLNYWIIWILGVISISGIVSNNLIVQSDDVMVFNADTVLVIIGVFRFKPSIIYRKKRMIRALSRKLSLLNMQFGNKVDFRFFILFRCLSV